MKETFVQFMKDQGCWEEFVEELGKEDQDGAEDYITLILKAKSEEDLVTGAFVFEETTSGMGYWFDIHRKWCDYAREIKTNANH